MDLLLDNPVSAPIIFDSHAHYDDEKFDGDRDELLGSMKDSGVCGIINCGCDIKSSHFSLKLSEKYDFIYAAVGIHPHEAADAPDRYLEEIKTLAFCEKAVAIGEIGLDYHYDFSPREVQLKVFEEQILLARELSLPVIVHDREAHADTLELLRKHRPAGVVHCFSGSAEMATEVLKLGMYIGLGGAVTFKNAKKPVEVARIVPEERLLLETDAPYMTPVPFRGKRCDSAHIALTAGTIAEIRNVERDDLIKKCAENVRTLFGL